MKVKLLDEHGWQYAMLAARRSRNSTHLSDTTINELGDNDYKLCQQLLMGDTVSSGDPHAVSLRMVHLWFDIEAPLYFWKHMDRYSIGKDQASDSTMYNLTKQPLTASDFVDATIVNLETLNWLIRNYNNALTKQAKEMEEKRLFASLPSGYIQEVYPRIRTHPDTDSGRAQCPVFSVGILEHRSSAEELTCSAA